MLLDQQQRFHRRLPFVGIVFGLGQLDDLLRGVAEGHRRFDRIEKPLVPRDEPEANDCTPAAPWAEHGQRLSSRDRKIPAWNQRGLPLDS